MFRNGRYIKWHCSSENPREADNFRPRYCALGSSQNGPTSLSFPSGASRNPGISKASGCRSRILSGTIFHRHDGKQPVNLHRTLAPEHDRALVPDRKADKSMLRTFPVDVDIRDPRAGGAKTTPDNQFIELGPGAFG